MTEEKKITIALAGNPNCGKTTLFNSLTGATAYVGNWPGVTVEKRSGTYKKDIVGTADIVDLPGIYSLSPYSPEEVISRNYILEENPDCVINVIDGTNLERNLYLTTQLLEMDVPVVVAVNMLDELEKNGQIIDCDELSKRLGCPVVAISALKKKNLHEMMKVAVSQAKSKRSGYSVLNKESKNSLIEEATSTYQNANISHPLFHAIKALEHDEVEEKENPQLYASVNEKNTAGDDFVSQSVDLRYRYISSELACCRSGVKVSEDKKMTRSDKIDKVLTNKWFGIPILIVLFFLVFHFVFSGDLFFLSKMGVNFGDGYPGFIKMTIGGEEYAPFAGLFYSDGGFNSFGEFLHCLAGDNETGILGCICLGIKQLLITCSAPEWLISFVYDGALNGVAAILGFVPQIMLLFFFSLMEDSGYMARVAFILDRIFRRFGVSGRAFIPMIMGFGCGVPAMMNTRTLASDKERTKTIRVIPFFTCGAKAEFLAVIAATVASAIHIDSGLFTFLMYLLGVVVAIVAVIVMNKTSQREQVPPFIMELPSYHRPQFSALMAHVWDKGKHFMKKASTIILASTIVIWFLANFKWNFQMVDENSSESILAGIGSVFSYIFTPMGFGVQANGYGWTFAVASIQGVIAKENVTAVMETLASAVGVEGFDGIVELSKLSVGGLVAFGIFNMLTVPCFASVATARSELKGRKEFWFTLLFWFGLSYIAGVITYLCIDFVWTLAIFVPLLVGAIVALVIYDRKKKKQEMLQAA